MPNWNPTPPPGGHSVAIRIVRVPAKGTLRGAITSIDPLGVNTHYVAHRTIPCERPNTCSACEAGHSWRYHCYLGLLLAGSLEHVLLELTAAASDPVRNYYNLYGALRGATLTASRPSLRQNGRVIVALTMPKIQDPGIPNPPNIEQLLSHIWGIAYTPPERPMPDFVRKVPFAAVEPGNGDARYEP